MDVWGLARALRCLLTPSTSPETPSKPLAATPKAYPKGWKPYLWPAYQRYLAHSKRPILVGPFRGEVGFEALYWLPFLRKWRERWGIDPARIIPITRGGAGYWYDAPKALELFEMREPRAVRVQNVLQSQQTGFMKQIRRDAFDTAVLADAAQTLGLRSYDVLDPGWMYQTLQPFFSQARGASWLLDRCDFRPLVPPVVAGLTLPDNYVAVSFYFRPTFPAQPFSAQFARETIKQIARSHPVVILTSGQALDDHLDYIPKDRTNVTVLSEVAPMTAANNLAVQSAVLGKAAAFVSTYGGKQQLALRMGVPSIGVYTDWHSTALAHRHLSDFVALQTGVPFHTLRVVDLQMLQDLLPRVKLT